METEFTIMVVVERNPAVLTGLAWLAIFFILLPELCYVWFYRRSLKTDKVLTVDDGEVFRLPDRLWLLSVPGLLVLLFSLVAIALLVCVIAPRYGRPFEPSGLVWGVGGTLLLWGLFLWGAVTHRGDFVIVRPEAIECQNGYQHRVIPYKDIDVARRRFGTLIIRETSGKKVRIPVHGFQNNARLWRLIHDRMGQVLKAPATV